VNSPKSRCILRPSMRSCYEIAPRALTSNIRNASTRLKSDLRARSILAASMSLSIKIIDFKLLANSYCSIRSKQPLPPFALGVSV